MNYFRSSIFAFVLLLSPWYSFASQLNSGDRLTIHSNVLNEDRSVQVWLPEQYQSEPKASYPVLYLLDGDYNFHSVSGLLDALANKGQLIPKVILVAIADKGTAKYRNYTTPATSSGAADKFLSFIVNELKPQIEKNYRTAPNSTLVGQSMGGLFVLNTLLEAPRSFTNFVAISPSVWVANNEITTRAKTKLSAGNLGNASLYLSLGDEQQMGLYGFIDQLDNSGANGVNWQFNHYPDENHNSVGSIALRDNLKHIFNGWYLPEKELEAMTPQEVIKHYQAYQQQMGFEQAIPTSVAHILIRQHYRQGKQDDIAAFVSSAITAMPASAEVLITKRAAFAGHYDSPAAALAILQQAETELSTSVNFIKTMASTYEQLKQAEKAREYYQKALTLAKQQNANQWLINILQSKI